MSKIENFIIRWKNKDDKEKAKAEEAFSANPFLVPFFNFFYYIALVPFKTEWNPKNNKYELKSSLTHQVLCAVIHTGLLVCVNFIVLDGMKKIKLEDSLSIVDIFDWGSNCGTAGSSVLLVYMLWMRRDEYLDVIEATRITFFNKRKLKITYLLVQVGLTIILMIFTILDWILLRDNNFGRLNFANDGTHEPTHLYQQQIFQTNISLHPNLDRIDDFFENFSIKNNTSASSTKDIFTIFKTIFYFVFIFFLFEFHIMCQLVFLALSMTLRQIGRQFSAEMLDSSFGFGEDGVKKGVQKYRMLKSITDRVRNVYGNALLAFYISAVAYYAEVPHIFWGKRGETEKMVMVYFVVSGVIWLIAAEFHNNVKSTVLKWIEFHIDLDGTTSDQRIRLQIISGEIISHDSNVVALSNKCFPVTYSHLGSMLGLVVTYGIIVFQLHQTQNTRSN